MSAMWPTVAGTGHRPASRRNPDGLHPRDLAWLREKARVGLDWFAHDCGTNLVRSGMALGWDLILARAAADVGLPLHADIPYESQPSLWSPHLRREWETLRAAAISETVWGPNPESYAQACELLDRRNQGLLQADALFAAWSGRQRGGTFNALSDAQRMLKPGVHLEPGSRRVRVVEPGGWF